MTIRWVVTLILLLTAALLVAAGGGYYCGQRLEHRRMQPQLEWALKIAKGWQEKYGQAAPLIRQWRMGYEQCQARGK